MLDIREELKFCCNAFLKDRQETRGTWICELYLPSELEKVPTLENIINTSGDPERNEV